MVSGGADLRMLRAGEFSARAFGESHRSKRNCEYLCPRSHRNQAGSAHARKALRWEIFARAGGCAFVARRGYARSPIPSSARDHAGLPRRHGEGGRGLSRSLRTLTHCSGSVRAADDRVGWRANCGVHPYNVTPEHTASARAIIGSDKWLCVEQKVLLVAEPSKAREIARQAMAFYLPLSNYRNNWKRLGFTDADLDSGGSNRFLDAMVAWGTETAINQRIQAHFDAGASHVA